MNKKTKKLAQISLLVSIIVLFSIPPMNSINFTATFGITLAFFPVLVGAILMGPISGLILGAIWGVCSFCQALAGIDLGPLLLSISPIGTFIVCTIPRAIVGLLTGLIYNSLGKKEPHSYIAASVAAPVMNTILFLGSFWLLFTGVFAEYLLPILSSIITINALIEAAAGLVIGAPIASALDKAINKSS